MAHLTTDFYNFLTGSTAVSALISKRCYFTKWPREKERQLPVARPYVYFRVPSDAVPLTMDGVGGVHQAQINVACVGISETSAQNVADAVKTLCDGYVGTVGTTAVHSDARAIFVRDKSDEFTEFFGQDEGDYVIGLQCDIWYST